MNHPLHSPVLTRGRETEAVGKGVISHPQLQKKKKRERERQEKFTLEK